MSNQLINIRTQVLADSQVQRNVLVNNVNNTRELVLEQLSQTLNNNAFYDCIEHVIIMDNGVYFNLKKQKAYILLHDKKINIDIPIEMKKACLNIIPTCENYKNALNDLVTFDKKESRNIIVKINNVFNNI